MRWAHWGKRLTAVGIGAALASGCQSVRTPPGAAAEPRTPEQLGIAPPSLLAPKGTTAAALRPAAATGTASAAAPGGEVEPASAFATATGGTVVGPVPENALDLGVALRLAGVNNPTINLAREAVNEALADQLAARALLLPSANVGANYRYHRGALQAATGFQRDVSFESLYLGAGAGVTGAGTAAAPGVRLFAHLGDAAYEPLAARQRVTVRRATAHAVQNDTLLAVAVGYLELVGAEARLDILRQGETDLAEIARLTAAYAKAGQGRKADADRAAANLELLRRDSKRAEEETATASARLCRLLSLDPSVRLRTPGAPPQPIRLVPEDTDPEGLIATALRARPEITARAAAVTEARVRTRQERVRPWVPTLSVGYSAGGFGGGLTGGGFGAVRGRSEFDAVAVWSVQGLGFGNRALVRAADAGMGAALAGYDLAVNAVRREVGEALADARAAATQIRTAEAALAVAEEGFKLESDRIKQVPGRPLELIDSFRQLLESRQELLRATVAFNAAQFRLWVAIGNAPE
ncbi:Outer membrane efflux protein [Gemmata obscuriglobus]|nr:TolC family protein [Gemmata obscuriglobus]QEG25509.1 Outer membrane efflux protein [Gemmata obscuriglobus]VTR98793.1 outer membrane protein : Outer membrane protein OS=Singulisphaera acidiphila (strain ATCC BAA-1392 / DSM 18658 / VKM B-2454 / MOB10) GN=Sinac_2563 PE=4 SV=1: OEP [Gemmata obscuriglobus UQM 2246]